MPTIDAVATGAGIAYPPVRLVAVAAPTATATAAGVSPSPSVGQGIPTATGFGWAPAPLVGDAALIAARGVVVQALAGPSSAQWVTYDLLEPQYDTKIGTFGVGEVPAVRSCRRYWDVDARVKGWGECVVEGLVPLGWRIRPMRHVRVGGVETVWPRGVYVMRPRAPIYHADGTVGTVCDLMDKTDLLAASAVTWDLTLPRGKVVVGDGSHPGEVLFQLGQAGEYGLHDSADFVPNFAALRAPLAWETGTSRLTLVNKLLDTINYWSLYVDDDGRYQLWPYRSPQARYHAASAWHLEDGVDCIYRGDVAVTQEIDVPNQITVVARGLDVDTEAYTARNHAGECGPYSTSYAVRDRWVAPRDGAVMVEATSSAQLVAIAERMLRARQSPAARVRLAMDWRPLVGNSVGTLTRAGAYTDALAVVTRMEESDDVADDLVVELEVVG